MKNILFGGLFVGAFLVVTLLSGGNAFISVPTPALAEEAPHPKMSEKEMEAFKKASSLRPEHETLKSYVGKWDYTVSWWMKADAKPEVSKGRAEIESILGGRYIKQKVAGTSMGQPFEGMGLIGFDNIKEHFSTLWIDNMGTGMMTGTGKLDTGKTAIAELGSFSCPMTDSGTKNFRGLWTVPKDNSFTYRMFTDGDDGKEYLMMEIIYKKG